MSEDLEVALKLNIKDWSDKLMAATEIAEKFIEDIQSSMSTKIDMEIDKISPKLKKGFTIDAPTANQFMEAVGHKIDLNGYTGLKVRITNVMPTFTPQTEIGIMTGITLLKKKIELKYSNKPIEDMEIEIPVHKVAIDFSMAEPVISKAPNLRFYELSDKMRLNMSPLPIKDKVLEPTVRRDMPEQPPMAGLRQNYTKLQPTIGVERTTDINIDKHLSKLVTGLEKVISGVSPQKTVAEAITSVEISRGGATTIDVSDYGLGTKIESLKNSTMTLVTVLEELLL